LFWPVIVAQGSVDLLDYFGFWVGKFGFILFNGSEKPMLSVVSKGSIVEVT
jgi:hypothetical protein